MDERQAQIGRSRSGIRTDDTRERMSSVDHGVDFVGHQPVPQALDPTEPADTHFADRQQGVTNATGERGDDIESLLAGSDVGEFPGFPGAA
ncbi:hypothetical protein GCM10009764_15190 [Nocardia ninae]|uniref:Uncharacterized protein n=1 Tax=Nocardia ninae NBRC 108245 TaxID=1210091 RepID=A0A511M6P8_9NOCA|nr:hypothetical protein NN4_08230 [Nocardia ninae NBRC 108245]